MPKAVITKEIVRDAARKLRLSIREARSLLTQAARSGQLIREASDRRVEIDPTAIDWLANSMTGLAPLKRPTAARRYVLLLAWGSAIENGRALGFREGQVTATFLNTLAFRDGKSPCRATLFNWRRSFYRTGQVASLADRRGQKTCGANDG